MRLEQIEKEAELFDNKQEAYIHLERTKGSNYKIIVAGDYPIIMQGIHGLLTVIAEQYNVNEMEQLKELKRAMRKCGKKEIL